MRLRVVAHVVGLLVRAFGFAFLVPMVVDWHYGNSDNALGFLLGAIATIGLGEMARRLHGKRFELSRIEGITVVAGAWLVVSMFAAIPYVWNGLSVIDSLFESMSGLTTTGATILRDFSRYSEGLFLWRSMTQWFGGMGVIALFIAVLPKLGIAGRQLFFAEAPGPAEDRLTPRVRHTAMVLWALYVALTALQVVLLVLVGYTPFDAVCNSMTTLAAGGFSPNPASIGGYHNPAGEWVFIAFMFLAGANFSLQYRALRGRPGRLLRDEEFRTYVLIVVVSTLLLAYLLLPFSRAPTTEYLTASSTVQPLTDARPATVFRHAGFQVLAVLTTTGFATDDFSLWPDRALVIMLVLMFIGGSAGSAGGGPKVVRILLVFKYATGELFKALHPQAIRPVRLNGKVVPPKILRAIVAFLLLYLMVYMTSVLVVAAFGADLMTAITASIATLGNIGPGFSLVGPMGTYADFPTVTKLVLFLNMWIGRLEVMTVLVLLQPAVWRAARWKI